MIGREPKTRLLATLIIVACFFLACLSGCTAQQPVVKTGDTVNVYYTVSLPGGTLFESNKNSTPLEFTVGSNSVVKGFDSAVVGMSVNQTKTVTVPAAEAYGPYKQDLIRIMNDEKVLATVEELEQAGRIDPDPIILPDSPPIFVWIDDNNQTGYLRFTNRTNDTIMVDENHPLAGKDLVFEITLVEIVK